MLSIYQDEKRRKYLTEHYKGGFAIVTYDYYGDRIRREACVGSRTRVQKILDDRADSEGWKWIGKQGGTSIVCQK